ncbi:MAG TPA: DUF1850 domain-containing protein [Rectinemataceae bacterium]|nr:DUF1850 domain-containing protein [Rectinemataceae bacterium]
MKRAIGAVFAAFFAVAVCALPAFAQDISRQVGSAAGSFFLIVSDRESRVIAEIPLRNNRFDHVFVHSYHLTPVVERFTVVAGPDGRPILHLFELEYESSGVGMPADAEGGYHLVDGKFILDMSRDFAVIPVMVSIVEGHGIVVDGHFYPFTDWVPQETQLFLAAKAAF